MKTYPTPPPNEGWCAPGTCGGPWSRILNGIYETFPLPPGVTVVNISSGVVGTSSTAGSQWLDLDNCDLTRHEIQTLISENVNLRASNAAGESIEYGSPNPDESRAALARVRALCDGFPGKGHRMSVDAVRAALETDQP